MSAFTALLFSLLFSPASDGHTFRSAVLTVKNAEAGKVQLQWVSPEADLPSFEGACQLEENPDKVLDGRTTFLCSDTDPVKIVFPMTVPAPEVLVIDRRTESVAPAVLAPGTLGWILTPGIISTENGGGGFFWHGLEHLLSGADHVAVVICLVLLIGSRRKLVFAIAGFTAGHAIGLGFALSDLQPLSSAQIETLIALSVVAMAVELAADRDHEAWISRWPISVSIGLGAIHGLGFAEALAHTEISRQAWFQAVVSFHLGLEAAQMTVAAATLIAITLAGRWIQPSHVRRATAYLLGPLGVCMICHILLNAL
jgi:hydrogenase/urease accessory protein HupE